MDKSAPRALTGVRKRQQIETTNKKIFVWLVVSSVIVSFSLVALQFLVREFMFNQKIINAKSLTNKQLQDNIEAGKELTKNVNALLANTNLNAVKTDVTNAEASNLSVVLDALPVTGDTTSFANSLQTAVFPLSGVTINELSTSDLGSGDIDELALSSAGSSTEPLPMPFKAGFNGKYADVQKTLTDLARVIRPISPTELSIRTGDEGKLQVTISGNTYYLPAKSVGIREEVLKP